MSSKLEQLKAKQAKLKAEISKAKAAERKAAKKQRDTALFTLGACWAALNESESQEDREMARKIWGAFRRVAPEIATDARKIALQAQFGLVVPDRPESNLSRPPSAELPGALPQTPGYFRNSDGAG